MRPPHIVPIGLRDLAASAYSLPPGLPTLDPTRRPAVWSFCFPEDADRPFIHSLHLQCSRLSNAVLALAVVVLGLYGVASGGWFVLAAFVLSTVHVAVQTGVYEAVLQSDGPDSSDELCEAARTYALFAVVGNAFMVWYAASVVAGVYFACFPAALGAFGCVLLGLGKFALAKGDFSAVPCYFVFCQLLMAAADAAAAIAASFALAGIR